MDFKLNAGGIIGALLLGGAAFAFTVDSAKPENTPMIVPIIGLVIGAAIGTIVWNMIVPSRKTNRPDDSE